MNCLDTNALIDYLEGEEAVGTYLDGHSNEPYFAPSIVLHEVFVGAARIRGRDGVDAVRENLDWVTDLPLTAAAASEAAVVNAELHGAGSPIGAMDTLIAGTVREAGGTLITADGHFDRVEGLDVVNYR